MSENKSLILKKLSSLEKKIEKTNDRIDEISRILKTEHLPTNRAKTEQFYEHAEQPLTTNHLSAVRGRHRELLALLVNNGFHTYSQISRKLNISESRARAYVSELKNDFNIPLRQIKDPEGLKVGLDIEFVEQILAFK